ncbi:MAG: 16S rRNA (uracil(1498)-N(3))-methyltransferase [Candidatus Nanopelagicales bacterium]
MRSAYFFADFFENKPQIVTLNEKESHHALNVRRLALAEEVYVTNGSGLVGLGYVTKLANPLEIEIKEIFESDVNYTKITVVQSLLKGERSDFAVELMTEVGVHRIIFWPANRSIAKISGKEEKALKRWNQISEAACKQSRRAWLPKVSYETKIESILDIIKKNKISFLLDYDSNNYLKDQQLPEDVLFLVGPEGGFSEAEKKTFTDAGVQPLNIGDTVLRGSSAGAVATALSLNL